MYIRLSKEDKEGRESSSIITQRSLLQGYIAENFMEYDLLEFCDKGYTGTNFQRPAVQQLLKMARRLEIHCIIVKDFSRFSRDYIELGSYLEQIFPFLGIRFISVNDHYDSQNYQGSMGDLDINFKSLLYDLYSKDLSRKVRSSLEAQKQQGRYVSSNTPFGYKKADWDRHTLVIVKEEAEVVRRIFALTLEGYTSVEIARLFNQEGVKTPLEFRREHRENNKAERHLWNSSTICRMLKNEVYTGCILQRKTQRETVGGKNRSNPRKDWLVVYNHHEPIITKEVFDQIQKNKGWSRSPSSLPSHPLTGKLVCGHCKKNLVYRRRRKAYFTCQYRYFNGIEGCVRRIDADWMERQVGERLQNRLEKIREEKMDRKTESGLDGGKIYTKIENGQQREREQQKKNQINPQKQKNQREKQNQSEQKKQQKQIKSTEKQIQIEGQKQQLILKIQKLKQQRFQMYQDYVYGRVDCFHFNDTLLLSLEKELMDIMQTIQDMKGGKMEERGNELGLKDNLSGVSWEKDRNQEENRLVQKSRLPLLSKADADQYIQRILVYGEGRIKIEWEAMS